MQQNNSYKGFYLILEGMIGSGKDTQMEYLFNLLKYNLKGVNIVSTREPGGTPKAEALRNILKFNTLNPNEELKILLQARESLLNEVIRPKLEKGELILANRSFLSSVAYQGAGRGLGTRSIWGANQGIVGNTFPDIVIYMDANIEKALERSGKVDPDKFDKENLDFWQRVQEGYEESLTLLKTFSPTTQIIKIKDQNGLLTIEQTSELINLQISPTVWKWYYGGEVKINKDRER